MSRPTVSIIVPSYNRAYIIDRAIDSVLAQTVADWELIVVDDGSKDNTQQVVEQFGDSRIRYLRHDPNRGVCAARNTGIEAASGTYVAFLDSDDRWRPEKLEKQLRVFANSPPKVGIVYTWLGFTDAQGNLKRVRNPRDRGNLRENLLFSNLIGTPSTVMVKRDCLDRGVWFDRQLRCGEDWDFYLQLAQVCDFEVVPEVLVDYCDDETSRSTDGAKATKNSQIVIEGHLRLFEKYHRPRDLAATTLGTLEPHEKAAYLFDLGRRLMCHGRLARSSEAIQRGQYYLGLACRVNSRQPYLRMHYLVSQFGGNFYGKAIEFENTLKRSLKSVLQPIFKKYNFSKNI
ncbi:glycosyltransferase [Geitlerinema sp. CS-897]|nr:glycosyltransferase [Geitlerinema sp. CS-897]